MAKRGSRLREFEKNNRVLDISSKQEARREKRREHRRKEREKAAQEAVNEGDENNEGVVKEFSPEKKDGKVDWKKRGIQIIAVLVAIMLLTTLNKIHTLKEKEEALQAKNTELLQIKAELEEEVKSIDDPDYIEAVARKNLKLAKSNELIFYFDEENTEENSNE